MTLARRLLAASAATIPDSNELEVDVGGVLRRLLLFDVYILRSTRLREIRGLVQKLGVHATCQLLESGSLRVYCPSMTMAQTGQATEFASRARKGALPLGSYCFHMVQVIGEDDGRSYIDACFGDAVAGLDLSRRDESMLGQLLPQALETADDDVDAATTEGLREDLRADAPIIRRSVAAQIERQLGVKVSMEQLDLRFHAIDHEDYRGETNLGRLLEISEDQEHRVIEGAVLGAAGVSQRIAEMKAFSAISGFRVGDLPLFEDKLKFLFQHIAPGKQEHRVCRVAEIAGLPDFSGVGVSYEVDIDRFMTVRDSQECREFRVWLQSVDNASDGEIRKQVLGLRARCRAFCSTVGGRVLRYLLPTVAGVFSPAAGPIVGALDTFILDSILGRSGPATFVGRMYPSLFHEHEPS